MTCLPIRRPLHKARGTKQTEPECQRGVAKPLILKCPKCGQRVVVHLEADAHCLPCGRKMRPVEAKAAA